MKKTKRKLSKKKIASDNGERRRLIGTLDAKQYEKVFAPKKQPLLIPLVIILLIGFTAIVISLISKSNSDMPSYMTTKIESKPIETQGTETTPLLFNDLFTQWLQIVIVLPFIFIIVNTVFSRRY